MELIAGEIPLDCEIFDTSDYHYGALNCHREGIREIIATVAAKKNRFLLNKGDSIDAVTPGDKRYASCSMEVRDNLLTPERQADALVEDFRPIRHRILAWGFGNHEYALINTLDFGRYLARQLQVPYGGVAYKLALRHKGVPLCKLLLHHGRGMLPKGAKDPIQREANQKAWVRRRLEETGFADCAYMSMGHIHRLLIVPPTTSGQLYLTDDGERIKQHYKDETAQNAGHIPPDSRWYVATGSFLKLYSDPGTYAMSYGEMAMYGPAELGCAKIVVQGGRIVNVEKVVV